MRKVASQLWSCRPMARCRSASRPLAPQAQDVSFAVALRPASRVTVLPTVTLVALPPSRAATTGALVSARHSLHCLAVGTLRQGAGIGKAEGRHLAVIVPLSMSRKNAKEWCAATAAGHSSLVRSSGNRTLIHIRTFLPAASAELLLHADAHSRGGRLPRDKRYPRWWRPRVTRSTVEHVVDRPTLQILPHCASSQIASV